MSTIAKYLPPATDVPSWASDTNYTNGPSPATPTKVAPSAGQVTEGWLPNYKPPAQWLNWFQNLLQQHVISQSGWHVRNWIGGARVPGSYVQSSNLRTPIASMLTATSGGLYVICAVNSDGTTSRVYNERNTTVSAVDATLAGDPVYAVHGAVFSAVATLVAAQSNGTVRKTTDFGASWASAGAVPSGKKTLHYFAAANRWIVGHTAANRIKYSGDLSTWSDATGAGAAPTTPRCIRSGATACIQVFDTTATVCARTADGIAWTLQTISAGAHDWRGVANNSVRSAWMAVASDGIGALSIDDGLAWTALTIPTGAQDVQQFGRYFVVVCTNAHGLGASIAVSEDLGTTWAEFLIDSDTFAQAYDVLLEFDGRLAACGEDTLQALKMQFSLRAPWMPTP